VQLPYLRESCEQSASAARFARAMLSNMRNSCTTPATIRTKFTDVVSGPPRRAFAVGTSDASCCSTMRALWAVVAIVALGGRRGQRSARVAVEPIRAELAQLGRTLRG